MKPNGGFVKFITDEIRLAVGAEKDGFRASVLNAKHSVAKIKELMQNTGGLQIVAAIYDTESGKVEFDT